MKSTTIYTNEEADAIIAGSTDAELDTITGALKEYIAGLTAISDQYAAAVTAIVVEKSPELESLGSQMDALELQTNKDLEENSQGQARSQIAAA